MKYHAFIKDIKREISNSRSRFISIIVLVALGMAFFVGIKSTGIDMKETADQYYHDQQFLDLRVYSTIGFGDKDINAIQKQSSIQQVNQGTFVDSYLTANNVDYLVHYLNVPAKNELNQPRIIEGRLPEKPGECAVEPALEPNLNDQYVMRGAPGQDLNKLFTSTKCQVVGIVNSPLYISEARGSTNIGDGKIAAFVYLPLSQFKDPITKELFIKVKGSENLNYYDDKYQPLIDKAISEIKPLGESLSKAEYDRIYTDANNKIKDGQKELDDNKAKAQKEFVKTQKELDASQKTITNNLNTLLAQEKQANTKFSQATKDLDALNAQIKDLTPKYAAQNKALESQNTTLKNEMQALGIQIQQLQVSLNDPSLTPEQSSQIISQINQLNTQITAKTNQVKTNTITIETNKITLEKMNESYTTAKASLASQKATTASQIKTGKDKLAKAQKDLDAGKIEFLDKKQEAETKFKDAQTKLDQAQADLKTIPEPEWIILDRNSNAGHAEYDDSANRMIAIANVFPLIFFVVAALVALTTMTRMVDEQRMYIGTAKALGYSRHVIMMKYLVYASSATIIGCMVGGFIGIELLPRPIGYAYGALFDTPPLITLIEPKANIFAIIASLTIIIGATLFASLSALKEQPSSLLIPKAPQPGKRILLERVTFIWKHLKFSQKVSMRNLFRYKKRFIMTIIGIGACTGLMLAGFGLQDSITNMAPLQFDEIYQNDGVITLDKNYDDKAIKTIETKVNNNQYIDQSMKTYQINTELMKGKKTKEVALMVSDPDVSINDYFNLRTRINHQPVTLKDGIIITEKAAKILGAKVGDEVKVNNVALKVDGVVEHYVGHYAYINKSTYEKVFKQPLKYNQLIFKLKDRNLETSLLTNDLIKNKEILSVATSNDTKLFFNDSVAILNLVVLIIIGSSGALAFVVLFNLNNINITERMREIATIKVLGFYDKEVRSYVYRENAILTLIGALGGIIFGVYLHQYLINSSEVDFVMFTRTIDPLSYVLALLLTLIFTVVVNLLMNRRLTNIDMVESLKSIE